MKLFIGLKLKSSIILLGVVVLLMSNFAWSMTLAEAKSQGLVGEKSDGLIAAVSSGASREVQDLITSTNAGRQSVYQGLAQRNNITLEQVGKLSFEKLRDKAASGDYIQTASGQWQRK